MTLSRSTSHRGVWALPGTGAGGETFLFVLDSQNRHIVPPVMVPAGTDADAIADGLVRVLDAADPHGYPSRGAPPLFRPVGLATGLGREGLRLSR